MHRLYEVNGQRALLSNLPNVLQTCAEQNVVKVAIVLPGDRRTKGQCTDGQLCPELIPPLRQLCQSRQPPLELQVETLIAWECDRQFLKAIGERFDVDRQFLEKHHDDDLRNYFPGEDWIKNPEAARKNAIDKLKTNHDLLLAKASEILETWNLILVGSQKVNPVTAYLWDWLAENSSPQDLRITLGALAHESALFLRRYGLQRQPGTGSATESWTKLEERLESRWEDRNVGWVHLLRSPWARLGPDRTPLPRFLIHLGGFYAQGTPAAMRQLIRICSRLAQAPGQPVGFWLGEGFDTPALVAPLQANAPAPDEYVPAHVVRAHAEIPWVWFVSAHRREREVQRARFLTPPTYEGTIHHLEGDPDIFRATLPAGPHPDYVAPYHGGYETPNEIGGVPLAFGQLGELLLRCSDGGTVRLAFLLPDNLVAHGQSTDVQKLPELVNAFGKLCEHQPVADNQHLKLETTTRLSWEVDDRLLERYPSVDRVFANPLRQADCRLLFPGLEPRAAYERMRGTQERMLGEARRILATHNLVIVGSPKVNRTMRNLCDVFAGSYQALGRAGMYVHPDDRDLPLRIRRFQGPNPLNPSQGHWLNWRERQWKHIHIGWLHLIRNPWAVRRNRFLIYLGGIHAQGTPASMLKLQRILERLAGNPRAGHIQLDHHLGSGRTLPAHILEADVRIPWGWFLTTARPGLVNPRLWTATPPSYDGSIYIHEVTADAPYGDVRAASPDHADRD